VFRRRAPRGSSQEDVDELREVITDRLEKRRKRSVKEKESHLPVRAQEGTSKKGKVLSQPSKKRKEKETFRREVKKVESPHPQKGRGKGPFGQPSRWRVERPGKKRSNRPMIRYRGVKKKKR